MPQFAASEFFASIAEAAATTAVGVGISSALQKTPHIAIPPPPGAAMVDPAGSAAAANVRRRQALAGGLGSTIGAGGSPDSGTAFSGATSGSKSLLGS